MKLVIIQNITLDGVIEVTESTGDWFDPAGGDVDMSDLEGVMRDMMANEDAFLLGRKTFEDMRGYWPNRTGDTTGITDQMNRVDKYVVASTMTDPQWENSTVWNGDFLDEVRTLKDKSGNDIITTGSISVCHALIADGLVDEYRLFVYPTVVGRARRLFEGDASGPHDLELVGTRQFRSGIVLLTYRPATARSEGES